MSMTVREFRDHKLYNRIADELRTGPGNSLW
jgi:hypothetical protein